MRFILHRFDQRDHRQQRYEHWELGVSTLQQFDQGIFFRKCAFDGERMFLMAAQVILAFAILPEAQGLVS